MAILADREIAALAALHIFPGEAARVGTMTAIALAESGGDTTAHNRNPVTFDDSYGLWQINMFGAKGPSRRAAFGIATNDELFDPTVNARAARAVYDGQGFNAWGVYTTGRHRQYLDRAATAARDITGKAGPFGDLPIGEALSDATDLLNPLKAWDALIAPLGRSLEVALAAARWIGDPGNWVRIVQVVAGVALGVTAASIVVRPIVERPLTQLKGFM